jgi:HSP20 family molecular chaperone IbpA
LQILLTTQQQPTNLASAEIMSLIPRSLFGDVLGDPELDRFDVGFDRALQRMGFPSTLTRGVFSDWPSTMTTARPRGAAETWSQMMVPAVDVADLEKEIVVHAELPGLPKDAVQIEVVNNQLVIKGENKKSSDYEEGQWRVKERSFGKLDIYCGYRRSTL